MKPKRKIKFRGGRPSKIFKSKKGKGSFKRKPRNQRGKRDDLP